MRSTIGGVHFGLLAPTLPLLKIPRLRGRQPSKDTPWGATPGKRFFQFFSWQCVRCPSARTWHRILRLSVLFLLAQSRSVHRFALALWDRRTFDASQPISPLTLRDYGNGPYQTGVLRSSAFRCVLPTCKRLNQSKTSPWPPCFRFGTGRNFQLLQEPPLDAPVLGRPFNDSPAPSCRFCG